MKTIVAIYENGVFRPTEPVDLPEHARVTVVAAGESPDDARPPMTAERLERFRGTLGPWSGGDPVDWQRRMRDEEWL